MDKIFCYKNCRIGKLRNRRIMLTTLKNGDWMFHFKRLITSEEFTEESPFKTCDHSVLVPTNHFGTYIYFTRLRLSPEAVQMIDSILTPDIAHNLIKINK